MSNFVTTLYDYKIDFIIYNMVSEMNTIQVNEMRNAIRGLLTYVGL